MSDLSGSTLLGRYRVDTFIARGGMADVCRGFDTQRHATVALKFMRPDFALDLDFERRFRREANTLAKLSHPNIVRYYELQRDGEQLFMVMDFIDGVSLQKHLFVNGPILPPAEVFTILDPLARALEYAHGQGVVHRDIKPSNIMISTDGEVFLTDFGVAKLVESATVTSVMAGTPAYMSPEQCASKELDGRSDQYSLAVLAYEMLAGSRPFLGESGGITTGTIGERIRVEHLSANPAPASQHNVDLPIAIDQTLARALSKKPSSRYPSTTKLIAALKDAIPQAASTPAKITVSVPEPASPRSSRFRNLSRRTKAALWMIGSTVLLALGLFWISPPDDTYNTTLTIANSSCEPVAVWVDGVIKQDSIAPNASKTFAVVPGIRNLAVCDTGRLNDDSCLYVEQQEFTRASLQEYTLSIKNPVQCEQSRLATSNAKSTIVIPETLDDDRTPTNTPTNTVAPPTNTSIPPTATRTAIPRVSIRSDTVNIREGPGTHYARITQYDAGTTLRVLDRHNGFGTLNQWYRVSLVSNVDGHSTGWIAQSVSTLISGVHLRIPTTLPQYIPATPRPTPTPPPTATSIPCHQTRDGCMTEKDIRDAIYNAGNNGAYSISLAAAILAYNNAAPGASTVQIWENRHCETTSIWVNNVSRLTLAPGATGSFNLPPGRYSEKLCNRFGGQCGATGTYTYEAGQTYSWYVVRGDNC